MAFFFDFLDGFGPPWKGGNTQVSVRRKGRGERPVAE
jgi:hypothetical protein